MKKVFLYSSIIFSLLIPVIGSAQLTEYLNIPADYTTTEMIYLVLIPVIGIFIIIWSILSKIRINRKISAIISIIVTVALLYLGLLSSLVVYLVPYLTDIGVAGFFIVISIIFFFWAFRRAISPMSLTRAVAKKYREAGKERGKIIGRMGSIDKKLQSRQEQKSRLETERSSYSLMAEDLSGYIKRGDLPNDVWGEIQRRIGKRFGKPSDALKWLNKEVKRRDDAINRLEMEITRLKAERTTKSEKLKEAV